MKEKILGSSLDNFKVEELEPRLEMGEWSAFIRSEQSLTKEPIVVGGFRYTF
jgi:hypothetical protein